MTVSTVLVLLAVLTPLKGQDDLFSSGFLSGKSLSLRYGVGFWVIKAVCGGNFGFR